MCLNHHRWILLHVASTVLIKANAQPLSPGQPVSESGHPSKTTVFAVLVTVFFFIGLLSVYIRHCALPNPEQTPTNFFRRRDSRRRGLETAVVESFPVFTYSSVRNSKLGSNDLECSICLNEFEDRETVRLLPICNHLFHLECIDVWLYTRATCPVCRSDLTAAAEKRSEDYVVVEIGKLQRSNSTGHSMGRFSDGFERFTLRLPEDVKRRIVTVSGQRLKRARSFDLEYSVGSGGLVDRVNWVDRFGLFVANSVR